MGEEKKETGTQRLIISKQYPINGQRETPKRQKDHAFPDSTSCSSPPMKHRANHEESECIREKGRKWEQKAPGATEGEIGRRREKPTGERKRQREMGRSEVGRARKQCDVSETDKPGRHGEEERTNEEQTEAESGRACCDRPLNNRFFILAGV